MSKIAKCPMCGDEPDVLIDLFDKHGKYPKGYSCCGAEFIELERWNQYATLLARHNALRYNASVIIKAYRANRKKLDALVEAVAWIKECELVRHYVIFDALETCALREITRSISAARAEVGRLLEGES